MNTRTTMLLALALVLALASLAVAQDAYEAGPIEIYNEGVPMGDPAADTPPAASWVDALTPAIKLGVTMLAIGLPMLVLVLGRLWRARPEHERALILLSWTMGRGRGFRGRVRSLAAAGTTARRPISPIAMLLAPRAFDAALDNATRAERAYGQPLRHAVHGFRKA